MTRPTRCAHVRDDATRCAGWANRTGMCPIHAGQMPRGVRTDNEFTTEKSRAVERKRWAQRKVRESAA